MTPSLKATGCVSCDPFSAVDADPVRSEDMTCIVPAALSLLKEEARDLHKLPEVDDEVVLLRLRNRVGQRGIVAEQDGFVEISDVRDLNA